MRRSREANLTDVLKKIIRKVRDSELAKMLGQKVLNYYKTKNQKEDLSLSESRMLYRDEDYGDTKSLSKKRKIDINWTDHAEYRSDLRDIDQEDVNQTIVERLRNKLTKPDSKKVKFKEPGIGTIVVDYNLLRNPAQADVVTVWAADELTEIKESRMDKKRIASDLLRIAELLTSREKIPLDRSQKTHMVKALRGMIGMDRNAEIVDDWLLTFSSDRSHKFHLFAIFYDPDGEEYVAGNAYGRIGKKPRAVEVIRSYDYNLARRAIDKKMRGKRGKGYDEASF